MTPPVASRIGAATPIGAGEPLTVADHDPRAPGAIERGPQGGPLGLRDAVEDGLALVLGQERQDSLAAGPAMQIAPRA